MALRELRMKDTFENEWCAIAAEPDAGLPRALIPPEAYKPIRSQLRVSHRVLNVRSGVVTVICQLVAAGVAQHVGMNRDAELSLLASASDDLSNRGIGHRASLLGREDVGRDPILAPYSSQCPYLRPAERMCQRYSVFEPRDVQQPLLEVDLVPA